MNYAFEDLGNVSTKKITVYLVQDDRKISVSEIIEMKEKIQYLESVIEEFRYIPGVGDLFFKAKYNFEENIQKNNDNQ
jgi:hypothetical protein